MTGYCWWDDFTARYDDEMASLARRGITVASEERDHGIMRLRGVVVPGVDVDGGNFVVDINLPASFPYFRPDVVAPRDPRLTHHQSPGGNLCLLEVDTGAWRSDQHLADYLVQQLPKVLASGRADSSDKASLPEVRQAESAGFYLPSRPNAAFLIDSGWDLRAASEVGNGRLKMAIRVSPLSSEASPDLTGRYDHLLGQVLSLEGTAGSSLVDWTAFVPPTDLLEGRWTWQGDPPDMDPVAAWRIAERGDSARTSDTSLRLTTRDALSVQVRMVLFPEESGWRETNRSAPGVAFILRIPSQTLPPMKADRKSRNPAKAAPRKVPERTYFIRALRAGETDLRDRAPAVGPLASKSVVLFGHGAIGSVVVDHLARAGLHEMTVVDDDWLEPGNLTRHAGSMPQVGMLKAIAAGQAFRGVNPYGKAKGIVGRVGSASWPVENGDNEVDVLLREARACDLLIDATAENGTAHFLADIARRAGKPYLRLWGTEGAWGGAVLLLDSGPESPCWYCYRLHLLDHANDEPKERRKWLPPRAPANGQIQPRGCISPTFTGTGFDLAEVSLQAARMIVGLLCRGTDDSYRETGHNFAVLSMRHDDNPTLPTWTGHHLKPHPDCRNHRRG